ncbi:MAG: septum formation initiator family protein [Bacteroidia bacterium]
MKRKHLLLLRNKYLLVAIFMLVWLVFFDRNNIFERIEAEWHHYQLRQDKAYYLEKIEETKAMKEELFSDEAKLEKFAREKYLMKKDIEDIFIIVKKEK